MGTSPASGTENWALVHVLSTFHILHTSGIGGARPNFFHSSSGTSALLRVLPADDLEAGFTLNCSHKIEDVFKQALDAFTVRARKSDDKGTCVGV